MPEITETLVSHLICAQFPRWSDLPIRAVALQGNDNRTFHLGDELLVRLPSAPGYVPQVAREQRWLPWLAEQLPLPIPVPLAQGQPSADFPFPWSVNAYLEGEPVTANRLSDWSRFAADLGNFLHQLQRIDATSGPAANAENCYRGADLTIYQAETYQALSELAAELPVDKLRQIWDEAVKSPWKDSPVWLHGDIAPSNLLLKDGALTAVIDFGLLAVGDPACDLAIGWTFFDAPTRQLFFKTVGADAQTIARGRAWALWKALISYHTAEHWRAVESQRVIAETLAEKL